MNNKGQAGIESVIVVAAIFLVVLVILSYYGAVNDSTIAMAILKSNTLERLADADIDGQYTIVRIDYVDHGAGAIDFTVETMPTGLDNAKVGNAWIDSVKQKIADSTGYRLADITITFNPT